MEAVMERNEVRVYKKKGELYYRLLDEARANGRWEDIPELCRKLTKHAPQAQCLILSAQVDQRTLHPPPNDRPHTAGSSRQKEELLAIPDLRTAAEKPGTTVEEVFHSKMSQMWIYDSFDDDNTTMGRVSEDLVAESRNFAKEPNKWSLWTHCCIVKAVYTKGEILDKNGETKATIDLFTSVLPYVEAVLPTHAGATQQFQLWTEQILNTWCSIVGVYIADHAEELHRIMTPKAALKPNTLLTPFRAWNLYCAQTVATSQKHREKNEAAYGFSRAGLWLCYYKVQGHFLRHHVAEPVFDSRRHQLSEFKRVELMCGRALFENAHFPQANEATPAVDNFIDHVTKNWCVLMNPPWDQVILGPANRIGLCQDVLKIIKQASRYTFHSGRIMRFLFFLHLALGELNLALRSLEQYFELASAVMARSSSSGAIQSGSDDEATALLTAARGLKALCHHGTQDDFERYYELWKTLESWYLAARSEHRKKPKSEESTTTGKVLLYVGNSLFLCMAAWAEHADDEAVRDSQYDLALTNIEISLRFSLRDEDHVELLYAAARIEASMNEPSKALTTVKRAIHVGLGPGRSKLHHITPRVRHRILKCWHLAALLLSADSQYQNAADSCHAAWELYGGRDLLYGSPEAFKSVPGLQMFEKIHAIEMGITHMLLIENLEGGEVAIASSKWLLTIYANAFGPHEKHDLPIFDESPPSPAPSTTHTHRSLRGSILGLPRGFRKTTPIARNEPSKLRKQQSQRSMPNSSDQPSSSHSQQRYTEQQRTPPSRDQGHNFMHPDDFSPDDIGVAMTQDTSLAPSSKWRAAKPAPLSISVPRAAGKMNRRDPKTRAVPPQTGFSPPTSPTSPAWMPSSNVMEPNYPIPEQLRFQQALECDIWLNLATIYRHSGMKRDADEAIHEAEELVAAFQRSIASTDGSSAANFDNPGAGGLPSSGWLKAQVLCAKAALLDKQGHKIACELLEEAFDNCPASLETVVSLGKLLLDGLHIHPTINFGPARPALKIPVLGGFQPIEVTMVEHGGAVPEAETTWPGSRDRALIILSDIVKGEGRDSEAAWFQLGRAYQASKRSRAALAAFNKAAKLGRAVPIRPWCVIG